MNNWREFEEKKFLSVEELDELESLESVITTINNGSSGRYHDCQWYTVTICESYLEDGESGEFDVYVKREV